MPWNESGETIVGGTGEVYVADVGTALPKTANANLNAAFVGLGYHTEDGVTTNQTIDINEYMAWQSKVPIRRDQATQNFTIAFSLLQWNENTLPFALGGGEVVEVEEDQYRYDPPAVSDALQEKTLIVDVDDGDRRVRFVVPRGTVTETGENAFKRGELSNLAVTFKALQPDDGNPPWYPLFNDAEAFAPGS